MHLVNVRGSGWMRAQRMYNSTSAGIELLTGLVVELVKVVVIGPLVRYESGIESESPVYARLRRILPASTDSSESHGRFDRQSRSDGDLDLQWKSFEDGESPLRCRHAV